MFKVVASKPVAHDSPDHHWNGGSTQNSYTNENFNSRLYEIISEGEPGLDSAQFKSLMCQVPEWARGLPIDVDAKISDRFC